MHRRFASLALLTAVAGIAAPASADPLTPPPVVAVDTVIEGGVHVWDHPIVVAAGATLTIRDATVWLDWVPPVCTKGTAGYCQPNLMVLPGGSLEVESSTFDSHGWLVDGMDSGYTIHAVGGTLRFTDSLFTHFTGIGAQGPAPERSLVRHSRFTWGVSGLTFMRGNEADIIGNEFEDVMYSISIRDSASVVRGNHINRSERLFNVEPFGRGLDVQSTLVGDKAFETVPIIEDNLVENGSQGMLNLNGFPNTVRNNTFRNNRLGLSIGRTAGETTLHHEAATFTGNRFIDNLEAVRVYVSGTPQNGSETIHQELRGNSFTGTGCTDIAVAPTAPNVTLTVDASGNWWGTPDGPQDGPEGCPALSGNVTADTWLTEAP